MKELFVIAGPCIIESKPVSFQIAEELKRISTSLQLSIIYKASYRKANRTSVNSFSGIGDAEALQILRDVKRDFGFQILTDVHLPSECEAAAEVADILQIPAFLCRQTDLLLAAGKTGKTVNIKKGQFMSASAMKFSVEKVLSTQNNNIMLTERGNSFGYDALVVDFLGIPVMKAFGFPVIVDCTHSLQRPNQAGGVTAGNAGYAETIAMAAVATGANGLFFEVHPKPEASPSDASTIIALDELESILRKCKRLFSAIER